VARIQERDTHARREVERLRVLDRAPEAIAAVERIERRVQRLDRVVAALSVRVTVPVGRLLLLDVGRVQQHESREFARSRGREDLALEAALD
jgi:hypothetical protein